MSTMELTQIYLARDQKKALQAKARANGTKVAEEVRRAVDAYLSGISPEDLVLLDAGTRKAQRNFAEMAADLDRQRDAGRCFRPVEAFASQAPEVGLSAITEILDRLSGVEVLKEKLRDTASRVEEWAGRVVELDRQVQDVDRRLVRIETLADVAQANRSAHHKLSKPG